MRIYFVGYMGSGKSRMGQEVASSLEYGYTDLDDLFEERYRISILDFFEKYAEEAFRKLEQTLLHETILAENIVVSTGGGTACSYDNMDFIKKSGISFYLKQEPALLASRLNTIRMKRPLLKNIRPAGLERHITLQLAEREPFYKKADYTLSGSDINKERIVELIRHHLD